MTCQPLWVILCHLLEKGSKEIEEIVEEMKERDREGRGTEMKVKKQKKQKHSPSTLTNVSWMPRWCKIHNTFTPPDHPAQRKGENGTEELVEKDEDVGEVNDSVETEEIVTCPHPSTPHHTPLRFPYLLQVQWVLTNMPTPTSAGFK